MVEGVGAGPFQDSSRTIVDEIGDVLQAFPRRITFRSRLLRSCGDYYARG